jgi:hypothetical protein
MAALLRDAEADVLAYDCRRTFRLSLGHRSIQTTQRTWASSSTSRTPRVTISAHGCLGSDATLAYKQAAQRESRLVDFGNTEGAFAVSMSHLSSDAGTSTRTGGWSSM